MGLKAGTVYGFSAHRRRSPALVQALDLLAEGFWPVAIKPGSKAPIGNEWGRERPTVESLRDTFARNPGAGVGIKLGKPGGVIDFDFDDPTPGNDSFCKLFGNEAVETRGWSNSDGRFHLLARWDDRLAAFDRTVIKSPNLPGLEIRIGALSDDDARQLQTVVPPTPTDKGEARQWNGVAPIMGLPDSFFDRLGESLAESEKSAPASATTIPLNVPGASDRYVRAALIGEWEEITSTPEGDRNNRLNIGGYNLGRLVGAGVLDRTTAEHTLKAAANQAGLGDKESDATIRSGLDAGIQKPRDLSGVGASPHNTQPRKNDKPYKRLGTDEGETFVKSDEFVGSQNSKEWPEPLSLDPMEAVPFPLDCLPEILADYCLVSADGMECPVDYFAAPLVVMAGGALGLAVRLEIEPGFRVPASLYLAVIGPPGTRKSPAIERIAGPLWDIDSEYRKLHKDAKRASKGDEEAESKPFRQLCVDDVTRESIAPILEVNPRGLVLVKDELTGWVLSQNAYKKGLGDDKQFWMSVNSCKAIKVNRKGAPDAAIVVPKPFISVVGALTPENMPVIRSDKRDDGWLDRILFSFPEPVEMGPWRRGKVAPRHDAWRATVMRLRSILGTDTDELNGVRHIDLDEFDRPSPRLVRLTDEAADAWEDGINAHREEQALGDFDPALKGPWSKMEGYAGRLALILGHLRLCASHRPGDLLEPTDIDAPSVADAWRLVDYFKSHHVRARGELADGAHGGVDHGRRAAAWIALGLAGDLELGQHFLGQGEAEVKTFPWSFARRRFSRWPDDVLRSGLAWLVRRHILAVVEGRETRTIYGVNPRWEPLSGIDTP